MSKQYAYICDHCTRKTKQPATYDAEQQSNAPCPHCGRSGRRQYVATLLPSTCHPSKGH